MRSIFQQRFWSLVISLITLIIIGVGLFFATGNGLYVSPLPFFIILLFSVLVTRAAGARPMVTFFGICSFLFFLGLALSRGIFRPTPADVGVIYVTGMYLLALAVAGFFFVALEFGVLRLFGMFRVFAIARITYYEALLQPFTLIILFAGIITISIFARVSFFTYDEDFKMYRDVASSFLFLFSMPIMIFASTKVIDEEIENRTMLTLMSKPVARWQVVVGKYLGVLLLVVAVIVTLGIITGVCGYLRFFDDNLIDFRVAGQANSPSYQALILQNDKAAWALVPSVAMQLLQVATLAAISVAVSTRYGLAANITTVVLIYMAANLARYAGLVTGMPAPVTAVATGISYLLPGLGLLDITPRLVFGNFILNNKIDWLPRTPTYGDIWQYVGISATYSMFYIAGILSVGVALFRSRELS